MKKLLLLLLVVFTLVACESEEVSTISSETSSSLDKVVTSLVDQTVDILVEEAQSNKKETETNNNETNEVVSDKDKNDGNKKNSDSEASDTEVDEDLDTSTRCMNCLEQLEKGTTKRIPVTLEHVTDGDTITVSLSVDGSKENTKKVKVRYLLVDSTELKDKKTGESQPYSVAALEENKRILTSAKQIYLETDVGEKYDKYGRLLAYVYADQTLVQSQLAKEGLVTIAYVNPPNIRYLNDIEDNQKVAKRERLNLWR